MNKSRSASPPAPNYKVKKIEPVVIGTDVQARIFTLAPGEAIPWHYHKESTDHYFVLEGVLTITTREPETTKEPEERVRTLGIGNTHKIVPRTVHLISNSSNADCRFLLLQGVGPYDWVKVNDRN